ncbi:hypothetical protein PQX77_013423 [Marasmius sp. AFHP31]|nr:hypothetical protein PQX77_013423 [Marasmius sp. AFHP31]
MRDASGLDDDTVSEASWQNSLDDLQKNALDAELKVRGGDDVGASKPLIVLSFCLLGQAILDNGPSILPRVVLDPEYNKPLDIETEERKWMEEWDEDTARVLRKMVEEAMEDYQYLLQYSV